MRANREQRWLLPPSMDEWVASSHPVRFVAALVETLDLKKLGFHQSLGDEGRPHFAPELLLGVWLFGWMDRIRSSRGLEKACQRDIAFVWLTGNLRPDHVTLWRFFDANQAALKRLFKHVVRVAAEAGLVGFALHALDGTKLRATSSMDTALHRKQLEELLRKLDELVETSVAQAKENEQTSEPDWQMSDAFATSQGLAKRVREALDRLREPQQPAEPGLAPPSALEVPSAQSTIVGQEQGASDPANDRAPTATPEQTQKDVREALEHLERHDTNHLHPSEPDARVMKTREGARLAYNAQAVVDHDSDLIVAIDVSGDETDHGQLVPMLEAVRETLDKVADQTVADAGYASGEQFEQAQRRHLPVIVNVQEESAKGEFAKSNFTYDAERDAYICPRGEVLPLETTASGKQARRIYRCHNVACPVRTQCTQATTGRTIKRLDTEDAFARQVASQSSPAKRILLSLRKEIVEHIFGIAKTVDGFRRFTARGLGRARAQWALVCLAINLRKLLPAWNDGRLRLPGAAVQQNA